MMELKDYMVAEVTVDELKELVDACNSWNGSLDHLRVEDNDEEFFSIFFSANVMEAVRAISFGNYNYNDDYVMFNGYGNLETMDSYSYDKLLEESKEEIIDAAIDNLDESEVMDILGIDEEYLWDLEAEDLWDLEEEE